MPIQPEPERFRDGGDVDGEPIWSSSGKMAVRLMRTMNDVDRHFLWFTWKRRKEQFKIEQRISYRARAFGDESEITVVVPADAKTFSSDLTSVPTLFTWLIPRTGSHLPAALVHDGLVYDAGEPQSYLTEDNRSVTRMQADTIFRDAMADLGTSGLRRWIMWAAVTLATIRAGAWTRALPENDAGAPGGVEPERLKNMYYQAAAFVSLAIIVVLGILATLDFLDWRRVSLPGSAELPLPVVGDLLPVQLPIVGDLRDSFMGERPWQTELWQGALAALIVPIVLAILWLRLWKAGVIAGVALAFLLHVTLVLAALTLVFLVIELLLRPAPGFSERTPADPPPGGSALDAASLRPTAEAEQPSTG